MQTVAADSHLHATCCSVSSSLPEHATGVIRWYEASGTMKPRETVDEAVRTRRPERSAVKIACCVLRGAGRSDVVRLLHKSGVLGPFRVN